MTHHHHFPQSDLLSALTNDLIIATIAQELAILKQKLQYAAHNTDFIDDRQELRHYLNELVRDLTIINRGLPPLPQEMEIFDTDRDS
jgi:hypothetical protein